MTTASEIKKFYQDWFAPPLMLSLASVADVLHSINRHPLANDGAGCDFFYPVKRSRSISGRFYIYGECQEVWSLFVLKSDERKPNPPVYLDSSLDLAIDHGYSNSEILDGNYVLAVPKFRDFLWDALAHQVLARIETRETLADDVVGITWCGTNVELGKTFCTRSDSSTGMTSLTSNSAVASPNYGAVFRDAGARDEFIGSYPKSITAKWVRIG